MPPKAQPLRKQPARNSRGAGTGDQSIQALSAPSPKEPSTFNNSGVNDTSVVSEHTSSQGSQLAITGSQNRTLPQSTSSETPAPATIEIAGSPPPARRPIRRLASVLPHSSSDSPSVSAGAEASEHRPPGLKYKPKSNARRSKEERAEFERAEAERLTARQAADVSSSNQGAFYGRGRGRGFNEMNRWKNERFNLSRGASGHLGGATIREGATRRGRGEWSGIGGIHRHGGGGGTNLDPSNIRAGNGTIVKPEKDKDGDVAMSISASAPRPNRARVKKESQGATYLSSEGELSSDGGKSKRKNIERINLISSDEEEEEDENKNSQSEVAKGKQRERTPHIPNNLLRPVRIQRQDHVERSVGVNTDASSLTSAELRRRAKERQEACGSLFLSEDEAETATIAKAKGRRKPKDVVFVRDERRWKGVYQDEDDKNAIVRIKDEPKDDDVMVVVDPSKGEPEPMAVDEEEPGVPLHTAIEQPIFKANEISKSIQTLDSSGEVLMDDIMSQRDDRAPWAGGYVGPEVIYTTESEESFQRELEAIIAVQSDEEATGSKTVPSSKVQDDEGDIRMDDAAENVFLDDDHGRSGYVFQLPPIIPSLRDASKKPISPKVGKKPVAGPSISQPTSASPNNPFNVHPKDDPAERLDPESINSSPAYPDAYVAGGFYAPGGQAGTLTVLSKASMRVYWGGMNFEISKGESGFMIPQEMMMTNFVSSLVKSEDESRWQDKMDVGEKAWAMGQTQEGFVCVPDWGSLLP